MKKITDYILKFEELDKLKPIYPYVFKIEKGDKKLLYYGTKHIFNPDDPEFNEIKKQFAEFKPEIALWEGTVDMDLSSEESARQKGEAVFLNYLAKQVNIPTKNLDVSMEVDLNFQAEKFSKNAAFAFFCLRQMNTLSRMVDQGQEVNEEKISLGLENRIKELKGKSGWSDFDFSLENLKKIFKGLLQENLELDISKWNKEWLGQHYHHSVLNEIFRSSIEFRDIYTVNFIIEQFKNYNRIFALMGGSHVYMQEPALRKWFETNL